MQIYAVLREKRRIKSTWISVETYRRMDERRQITEQLGPVKSKHLKSQREVGKKDKEVKASTQADKKRMIDSNADEAESASRDNNISNLSTN